MAGFSGRRIYQPYHKVFPPSPRPALAERSSPMGKGEILGFLMQGASPLASPGPNPGDAGAGGGVSRASGGLAPALPDNPAVAIPDGGHGGFGRRLSLPLAFCSAPIPPARARRALFPRGEGGDFWFSYARGFAPCIPGAEPRRHRNRGSVSCASGGLAPALPDNPAVAVPDGGERRFWSPAEPATS